MPKRAPLYVAGIALAIPIILPLLVWTYAKRSPELAGIPFYYWYQFLLVIVSVIFTSIAYQFVIRHDRERRAQEKSAREKGQSA